ncbi:MAG: LamG domain-containing protein [bacterium]|nr:LamG domain-containing protein [bacterium]
MKKRLFTIPVIAIIIFVLIGAGTAFSMIFFGGTSVNLQKGLVGWWKMDGNAKDATPNSNHGTLVNNTVLTTDRKGQTDKAYSFPQSGTLDSIGLGTGSILNPGTSDFTYAFWANGTSSGWGEILNKANGDYSVLTAGFNITFRSGPPAYIVYTHSAYDNGVTWSNVTNMTDGTWHHWAIVGNRAAGTVILYKDGVSQGANSPGGSFTTANITTSSPMNFGNQVPFWTSRVYTGSMDDVRIYNRALSATEITALYESYNPGIVISDLQKGLVGNWKMDGNAKDSTPNSNHGTVTGATLTTDRKGQTNKAYSFNGTTNYVSVPTSSSLQITGSVSISVWVNAATQAGDVRIVNKESAADTDGYALGLASNNIAGKIGDGTNCYLNSTSAVSTGAWNHLVMTGDGVTMKMYINGVQISQTKSCGSVASNTSILAIGARYSATQFFTGSIDDVRIYNRALSATEVLALYESYR